MANFLFVYRNAPYDLSAVSPEQMQESMGRWTEWIGKGFQEGWMVDPGDALLPDGRVVVKDRPVTDGPFVEAKEVVGGYALVRAASLDEAIQYAQSCPQVIEGGSVEIRPLAGLSGPKG